MKYYIKTIWKQEVLKIYIREDYFNEDLAGIRKLEISDFSIDILKEYLIISHYIVKDNERKNMTIRTSIWKNEDNKQKIIFIKEQYRRKNINKELII